MPIPTLRYIWSEGIDHIPYAWTVLKILPWLGAIYLLRYYFNGATNRSERNMHSKVVMITGGTSGIGAQIARELASRGAQIVLLTQYPLTDPFLADYIMDLRNQSNNELITAEQVDLSSLHSIRKFATKWVDNAPPRRLDTIILCANTLTPALVKPAVTVDGIDAVYGLNYIANFHLLSILSPALRAQPPDRDVRILFATCASYMGGSLDSIGNLSAGASSPKSKASGPAPWSYASSKLALTVFALAFQKHLAAYSRPDKQPNNARVLLIDPGFTRTPGMRRFLTLGSLWGLLIYLITYPFWFLVLKSPEQGAQTFLYAAMEARFGSAMGLGEGQHQMVRLLKECREVKLMREEIINDEKIQEQLWKDTEDFIQKVEKASALRQAKETKREAQETKTSLVKVDSGSHSTVDPSSTKKPGPRRSRKVA